MSRATVRIMSRSKVALLFVASQLGVWTGCNAILGNGYGAFDESAVTGNPEGGPEDDALVNGGEGGPGTDGQVKGDGGPGVDGMAPDAKLPDGGTCPRMVCPKKLSDALGPQRIALGTLDVYWTTATDIGRVGYDGIVTVSKTVVGGAIAAPLKRDIVIFGNTPYVTVADRGAAKCTAALSDSCTNTPFIGTAVGAMSSSLAVDSTKVFIGIFVDSTPMHGGIWQTDVNGNTPVPYTNIIDQVLDLRLTPSALYYMTGTAVRSVSLSVSGTSAIAATFPNAPVAFDVQGSNLVVATSMNELRVCPTVPTTGCVTNSGQTRGAPIAAVVLDGATMIWAESGSIFRAALTAGAPAELLAEGQDSPVDLAVDASFIYWANHGGAMGNGGAIMKLVK